MKPSKVEEKKPDTYRIVRRGSGYVVVNHEGVVCSEENALPYTLNNLYKLLKAQL